MILCGLMVASAEDGSEPGPQAGAKTLVTIIGLPGPRRCVRWRPT
jgi:hypothetical protein